MFIHTITIYNKYKADGVERWQRTVISGVLWNSMRGAVIRKTGVASVDGLQLIIPFTADKTKGYAKPSEWGALADKTGKWTLAPGDTVLLGEVNYEVLKSSRELIDFDDGLTISNIDTKAFGTPMDSWEVTGK